MTTIKSFVVCGLAFAFSMACSSQPKAAPQPPPVDKPAPAVAHASTARAVLPPGHPALGESAATQAVNTAIEPPKDGIAIETVWKTRASLAGKSVTVRGKVMKFTAEVLGVNWIHLQDGSGSAAEGTNDITVTSNDETKVGEVITVTGTVGLNKDLGSGYSYAVIIEHAQIAQK